jgi:hypothetical protein
VRKLVAAACALLALGIYAAAARPAEHTPATATRCAGERWAVRNLLDADAANVDYRPTATSVPRLRSRRPPRLVTSTTPRLRPVEFTTYALHVPLIAAQRSANGDTAVVVGAPPKTLVVVFPDTHRCADVVEGPKGQDIHTAGDEFEGYCGVAPRNRWQRLSGRAALSGVGFFSAPHAKPLPGSAPKGIELHPALSFSARSCVHVRGHWP